MEIFKIKGGKSLSGEILVSGSKNACLPILAATVLNSGTTKLTNVPFIKDALTLVEILKFWGAEIVLKENQREIKINNSNFEPKESELANELFRKLRGSILLVGPVLSKFGKIKIPLPGGDLIGARPLDAHFDGFVKLGAILEKEDSLIKLSAPKGLVGSKIVLKEISVTATENLIMAAAFARGETIIKLAATEPHVQDLCFFLGKLGVKIQGIGSHILRIQGLAGKDLNFNLEHQLIPDSDETMNLAALAGATRSEIALRNINPDFIDAGLLKLEEIGVNFELGRDFLAIKKPTRVYQAAKYQCGLYPKLMSDQIPPLAVLATQAQGVSMIQEWMYEGRLGYINELVKMGANGVILDPHRALIIGPTPLQGAELKSLDIRAGMTAIIAGLVAEGETTISDAQVIDRGFEKIDKRLRQVGAEIKRQAA
ncbi:MAG: UDP-N-acetylglucosamine 1-carboxyvinyltransferase [Patescibacteria group bacterium]